VGIAIIKVFIAAVVISFSSWLSNKRPELAGFIVALPIATLIVLVFSHFEWGNSANTIRFAKSIFVGIPFSLLFFIPFLLAEKFNIGFWECYGLGLVMLIVLVFSHFEWGNSANTIRFAKSIFVGIPFSLLFFIPFLLAEKFNIGFWECYGLGLVMLIVGFFAHRAVMTFI